MTVPAARSGTRVDMVRPGLDNRAENCPRPPSQPSTAPGVATCRLVSLQRA